MLELFFLSCVVVALNTQFLHTERRNDQNYPTYLYFLYHGLYKSTGPHFRQNMMSLACDLHSAVNLCFIVTLYALVYALSTRKTNLTHGHNI